MHSGWGATCTADPLQTLHANVNDRVLFVLASLQTKPNDDGASMVESTDAQIDWGLGKPKPSRSTIAKNRVACQKIRFRAELFLVKAPHRHHIIHHHPHCAPSAFIHLLLPSLAAAHHT